MDINDDSSSESSFSESWTLMDNERWEDFAKADNENFKTDDEDYNFIYKKSLVNILSSIKSKDELKTAQESGDETDGISVISESDQDSSFDFGEDGRNQIQNEQTEVNTIDVTESENIFIKIISLRDNNIANFVIAASVILLLLTMLMHETQYESQRKVFLIKRDMGNSELQYEEYVDMNSKSLIVCTDASVICIFTECPSCSKRDNLEGPEFQEVFNIATKLQIRFHNSKEFSKEYAILWRSEIYNPTPESLIKKLKDLELRLETNENKDNVNIYERVKNRAMIFKKIHENIRKLLSNNKLVNENNNKYRTKFETLFHIFKLADEYSKELINKINDVFLFGQEQSNMPNEYIRVVKVKLNKNLSLHDLYKRVRIQTIELRKFQKDVQMFLSNNNLIELKEFKTIFDIYKLADEYSKELNYKITEFLSDKEEIFINQDGSKIGKYQTTDEKNVSSEKLEVLEMLLNTIKHINNFNIYGRNKNQTIELKKIRENERNSHSNHSCAENSENDSDKQSKNVHEEYEMKSEQFTDSYFSLTEVKFGYDSANNDFNGDQVQKSKNCLVKSYKQHNPKKTQFNQNDKVHNKKENKDGAWMHKMAKNRQKQRENHKKSDWLFERAQMRNSKQNKAMWYFSRMDDREGHRRHDEHITKIKKKNHSKKKK